MRRDYNQLPDKIKQHGFDFHWSNEKLWALVGIPIEDVDVREIEWQLDFPFWNHEDQKYVLCPRAVMNSLNSYPHHRERILNADTTFPIDLMENRDGKLLILDGCHRLIYLMLKGHQKVKVRKIPKELVPLIEK